MPTQERNPSYEGKPDLRYEAWSADTIRCCEQARRSVIAIQRRISLLESDVTPYLIRTK